MESLISSSHWNNYQNQIKKYLDALEDNPYYLELKDDFKNEKLSKITQKLNDKYSVWIKNLVDENVLNDKWIDDVLDKFLDDKAMNHFANYINTNTNIILGNTNNLIEQTSEQFIKEIYDSYTNNKLVAFNPTELKFVTTTAISFIDTEIDPKFLYENFNPPKNILENRDNYDPDEIIYHNDSLDKMIGCKPEKLPAKGFFKKNNFEDFYNCTAVNIVLDKFKSANVKMFNNGKLQLTGIPKPSDGTKAVDILCKTLMELYNNAGINKTISIKNYRTVMINTCYELGFSINREILYEILLKRYSLNAIYDSEGYPGVRIHYYYNTNNINTANEGICTCIPTCEGKGSGCGHNNCRKLSVAIFQSGSTIIAGGCENTDPIYCAYNFINKIISEIMCEIKKDTPCKKLKKLKSKKKCLFITKQSVSNYDDIYEKLLKTNL